MPLIVHSDLEIKLLVLRTAGILFPILVMVRALANFHRRRQQQERRETYISSSESEEEEEGEEEEDDTVTNSARSNYLQPRIIPVY